MKNDNNPFIIGHPLRKRISLQVRRLIFSPFCLSVNFGVFILLFSTGNINGYVVNNKNTWAHSLTFSSSPTFTNRAQSPIRNDKYNTSKKSGVKMISTKSCESSIENMVGTSLASEYVIYMMNDSKWKLMPIDHPNVSSSPLIGTQALEALQSTPNDDDSDDSIVLECLVCKDDNDNHPNAIVTVKVKRNHQKGTDETKNSEAGLISVLSRILVQSTVSKYNLMMQKEMPTKDTGEESSKNTIGTTNATTTISLPDSNGQTMTISIPNNDDFNPCLLFQDLLPSSLTKGNTIQNVEMNDLVNQNGQSVGHVPRSLVYKYNLLHSGIGLIIMQQKHQNNKEFAFSSEKMEGTSLYCHRRTDTKRIFPSLYDMFVGGVCTAGEGLLETAYRELEEELGLSRKEAFSKLPLFSCTCCTSYNRCIVAVYSYQFDQSKDSVRWQPEEVAWGELVPYTIVEKAAQASIKRYQQSKKWPGNLLPDCESSKQSFSSNTNKNVKEEIPQWDFVPDGLLVWEAWLHWLQKQQQS